MASRPDPDPGGTEDAAGPDPAPARRPDGVTLVAILMFVLGILSLLGAALMIALPSVMQMSFPGPAPDPSAFVPILGSVVGLIGLLQFVAGWGTYTGQSWARILTMAIAVVALVAFPIGTILGAIVLYYLTRPPVRRYFEGRGAAT